jgi:riboflavin synthase
VGAVSAVRDDGFARVVTVQADPELLRYVVHKGSIHRGRRLAHRREHRRDLLRRLVIPRDARAHEPRDGGAGTPCHLEVDILAKYVEKLLS